VAPLSGSATHGSVAGRSKSGPSSSCASVTTWPTWTTTANNRGAGAVCGYAIQLAKADGLSVLARAAPQTTNSSAPGADMVVDRWKDAAQIRSELPKWVR